MVRKPFYVHDRYEPLGNRLRGFSVLVEPLSDTQVNVAVTFCSAKDAFSKKAARAVLETKPKTTIAIRDLPRYLGACRVGILLDRPEPLTSEVYEGQECNYYWVWRYLLP